MKSNIQNIKKHKSNKTLCYNIFRITLIIFSASCYLSCEDFVEVELPNSQINGATVFENVGTATAAMTNIYAELRDNGLTAGTSTGIGNLLAHYTDELDSYDPSQTSVEFFYRHTIISTDPTVSSIWDNSYNLIFAANSVLNGLEESNTISLQDKEQLMGEALFVRGLIHFYLTNLFGDIPFISSTDYLKNSNESKKTTQEVYQNVIEDLLMARDYLTEDYITSERIRPNKSAVTAFLARVYLYAEDWMNAQLESSEIIDDTNTFTWESDLTKVFLKDSQSIIWQFKPNSVGDTQNTFEALYYVFEVGPPSQTAFRNDFINSFEPNDGRFTNWVGSATNQDMTETWYYPFKYKVRDDSTAGVEYSILLRLAEQYLIRAEASARLGNLSEAAQDLNVVRNRAGLPNVNPTSLNDALDAILKERQVEFFTEFGHRFFDLKRTDKLDEILGVSKPEWESKDVLLPIPEDEILVNDNLLPQNPGYN